MKKMNKKTTGKMTVGEKILVGAGTTTGVAGATTAIAGESIAWAISSAGPGAALTGCVEANCFACWLAGGSLAAGGGGIAGGTAILAAMGPVGWTVAGVGALGIGIAAHRARKRRKLALEAATSEEDCHSVVEGDHDA